MSFSNRLFMVVAGLVLLPLLGTAIFLIAQSGGPQMRPTFLTTSAWLAAGLASFSLVIAFLALRTQLRPLHQLSDLIHEEQDDEHPVYTLLTRTDEFGQIGRDIDAMLHALKVRSERLDQQRRLDPVTGLPNRSIIRDRIEMATTRAQRQHSFFAVVCVDVLKLSDINSRYGHQAGDIVLKIVAERLTKRVRASDTVCRMGSDEFVVVIEDGHEDDLLCVAAQMAETLNRPVKVQGHQVHLQVATGLALFPMHGREWESLIRRANIAMQTARELNLPLTAYAEGQDESNLRQITLQDDIRDAVARDEMIIHYQPKLCLADSSINQVEALVRWQHRRLGLISPDEFIPIAEKSGQIQMLTHWILETVLHQQKKWDEKGLEIQIAVNLSPQDLNEEQIVHVLRTLRQATGTKPENLILEVTESSIFGDMSNAAIVIQALREEGYQIAIDDYGTGYSSLAQLKSLPVRELKIDRSFVSNMVENADNACIVRSTIEMAHNLGLKVVAEGVETEQELNMLAEWNCDIIQGYYLGQPMEAENLPAWVLSRELMERCAQTDTPSEEKNRIIINADGREHGRPV